MEKWITSGENRFIRHLKKLQSSRKYREQSREFVVEGARLAGDAARQGVELRSLVYGESYPDRSDFGTGAPVYVLPDKLLKEVSDTVTPQGILAVAGMKEWPEEVFRPATLPLLLYCDGVSDPGNLGTILRTLDGAGGGVLLGAGCADLYHPKTVRSTMSSIFNLPVRFAEKDTLSVLKEKGYRIVGSRLEEAEEYTAADLSAPTVIIIGNEASGMSDSTAAQCDTFVKIPLRGKIESLNAAVAAAVLAYETLRQQSQGKEGA